MTAPQSSSPGIARADLELAIQRALMDDDSYGVGADDQDALEAAASFSATFIANAIADLQPSPSSAGTSPDIVKALKLAVGTRSDGDAQLMVIAADEIERMRAAQCSAGSTEVTFPPTPVDVHAPPSCVCGYGECCVCPTTERALRAISNSNLSMTAEQREWCLNEIGRVEGYDRKDYEAETDKDLARTVISAWVDYARDKGLM